MSTFDEELLDFNIDEELKALGVELEESEIPKAGKYFLEYWTSDRYIIWWISFSINNDI